MRSKHAQATIIELELEALSLEYYRGEISKQEYEACKADLMDEKASI